jgi:hypothetical protein
MYRTDTDTDLPVLLYVRTVLRTVRYLQYVKMSEILLSNDDYLNDCFCAFFGSGSSFFKEPGSGSVTTTSTRRLRKTSRFRIRVQ